MAFILHPWQLLFVILAGWVRQTTSKVECRERLGGLLRYYCRKAA